MEQSPSWEADRFSASQGIPLILWNPNFHYSIHKCPPPVPIMSQLDPIHTPTSHILKILLNITLLSTSDSPKCSLTLWFPHQNPVYDSPLPHARYMFRPSNYLNSIAERNVDDRFRVRVAVNMVVSLRILVQKWHAAGFVSVDVSPKRRETLVQQRSKTSQNISMLKCVMDTVMTSSLPAWPPSFCDGKNENGCLYVRSHKQRYRQRTWRIM
jgi:hypothetical protein